MRLASFIATLSLAMATPALADQYPSKPINFVVPFSTGSSIDTMSRIVLEEIRKQSGAISIVEYKPGALGAIGLEYVSKAAPDGYTLMPSSSATNSSGPQLAASLPYDAIKDFSHLTAIVKFDLMLVTRAESGITTVEQLITAAKNDKNKLNYGYGSATGQVAASAFSKAVGVEMQGIPYKGQPLAINDLIGGQVQFVVSDVSSVMPHVRAGRLNALAVASANRSSIFPDVPTLQEAGVDLALPGWVGFAGPANMPPDVRAWWETHVADAIASPSVIEQFKTLGMEPFALSGQPFQDFVKEQYAVWGRHIKEAGLSPQ